MSTILFTQPTGSHFDSSTDIFKSSMGGKSLTSNSPLVLITISFFDVETMLPSISESLNFSSMSLTSSSTSSSSSSSSSELKKRKYYYDYIVLTHKLIQY